MIDVDANIKATRANSSSFMNSKNKISHRKSGFPAGNFIGLAGGSLAKLHDWIIH
jgi:hypothetical protein